MATNPPKGDGRRNGAVRDRSQTYNPRNGHWVKRDAETGRFMDQKGFLGDDFKPDSAIIAEKNTIYFVGG